MHLLGAPGAILGPKETPRGFNREGGKQAVWSVITYAAVPEGSWMLETQDTEPTTRNKTR